MIAALLDGVILGGATWIVLGPSGSEPSLTPTFDVVAAGDLDTVAWLTNPWLVGLLVAMLALQGWTGATPGKRVAGVAIVRLSDGLPAGFGSSALRVVAHLVDAIFLVGAYLRPSGTSASRRSRTRSSARRPSTRAAHRRTRCSRSSGVRRPHRCRPW